MASVLPLAGYLLLTLLLAVWVQRRAKSGTAPNIVEEYFIGGRSMVRGLHSFLKKAEYQRFDGFKLWWLVKTL